MKHSRKIQILKPMVAFSLVFSLVFANLGFAAADSTQGGELLGATLLAENTPLAAEATIALEQPLAARYTVLLPEDCAAISMELPQELFAIEKPVMLTRDSRFFVTREQNTITIARRVTDSGEEEEAVRDSGTAREARQGAAAQHRTRDSGVVSGEASFNVLGTEITVLQPCTVNWNADGTPVSVALGANQYLLTPQSRANLTMDTFITSTKIKYAPASTQSPQNENEYQPIPGTPIPPDSFLYIKCLFNISEDEIKALQTGPNNPYEVTNLAPYINNLSDAEKPLLLNGAVRFGTLHMKGDDVFVTFEPNIIQAVIDGGYAPIQDGALHVFCQLDEEAMKNAAGAEVQVNIGGEAVTIPVERPAMEPVTVKKSGAYSRKDGVVNWKAEIAVGDRKNWDGVSFRDEITGSQAYVPNSFKVNNAAVLPDPVNGTTLSYPLGEKDVANKKIAITYQTHPNDNEFDQNIGAATTLSNTAQVVKTGEATPLAENKANDVVMQPEDKLWLEKEGKHIAGENKIAWKVTLHTNGYTLPLVMLHDEFHQDLTLDVNSVKREKGMQPVVTETTAPQNGFTAAINNLSDGDVITYDTAVDDKYYQPNPPTTKLTNKAWLTFDWPRHDGTTDSLNTPEVGLGIEAASAHILKAGRGYNPATQEITWEITVNQHHTNLTGVVVTDTLGDNQKIIPAVEQNIVYNYHGAGNNKVTPIGAVTVDERGPGRVVFTFPNMNTGENKITFQYKTKVTSLTDLGTNSANKPYQNVVELAAKNNMLDVSSSAKATQKVTSTVIAKAAGTCDYADHRVSWVATVNQNNMKMTAVELTDPLPPGVSAAADDPIVVKEAGKPDVTIYPNAAPQAGTPSATYSETEGLRLYLGNIEKQQTIYFTTLLDMDYFETHGDSNQGGIIEIKNKIKLEYGYDGGKITETSGEAVQTVRNQAVRKTGVIDPADKYKINYAIMVNPNGVKLQKNSTITDQLPKYENDTKQNVLELDTATLRLERGEVDADGRFTRPIEIAVTRAMYSYNAASDNKLTFTLPAAEGDTSAYRLSYSAEVVTEVTPIKNTVKFNGTGANTGGSAELAFQVSGGGGGASVGRNGTIIIQKQNEMGAPLQGAVFEALRDGSIVKEGVTNAQGEAKIDGLKPGTLYELREKTPPVGYKKTDEVKTAIAGAGSSMPTVTFQNSPLTGDIFFGVCNELNEPLAGVAFALCAPDGTDLAQALSDSAGLVRFPNIPFGAYQVKEVRRPLNHEPNTGVFTAEIEKATGSFSGLKNETGKVVSHIVNRIMRGEIVVHKTTPDGKLPLAGAEFELWQSGTVVATGKTNVQNQLRFESLLLGKEYAVKETVPPQGYQPSTRVQRFALTEEVKTLAFEWENLANMGEIRFMKTAQGGRALAGAKFALYASTDTQCTTPLAIAISGADGMVCFTGVPIGSYLLKEIEAPAGYYLNQQTFKTEMNINGACEPIFDVKTNLPLDTLGAGGSEIVEGQPIPSGGGSGYREKPVSKPDTPQDIVNKMNSSADGETIEATVDEQIKLPLRTLEALRDRNLTIILRIEGEAPIILHGSALPPLEAEKLEYNIMELRVLGSYYVQPNPDTGWLGK